MNITFISDTHNQHNLIPKEYLSGGDILIHSGDITSRGHVEEVKPFLNWFNSLPYKHKIFIAGNHDFFFERPDKKVITNLLKKYPDVIYLNDSGVEIEGIKIWGSPVQPYFGGWAFNRVGDEIQKHWDLIPKDTNILITHGGPIGVGYNNVVLEGRDVGCPYLANTIHELTDLKIFCQGHIHEGYGRYRYEDGPLFLNASVLNRRYEMQNRPIFLELLLHLQYEIHS